MKKHNEKNKDDDWLSYRRFKKNEQRALKNNTIWIENSYYKQDENITHPPLNIGTFICVAVLLGNEIFLKIMGNRWRSCLEDNGEVNTPKKGHAVVCLCLTTFNL